MAKSGHTRQSLLLAIGYHFPDVRKMVRASLNNPGQLEGHNDQTPDKGHCYSQGHQEDGPVLDCMEPVTLENELQELFHVFLLSAN